MIRDNASLHVKSVNLETTADHTSSSHLRNGFKCDAKLKTRSLDESVIKSVVKLKKLKLEY